MKIRIGKELHISWSILTQGENKPLEGRDLRLYLQDPNRRRRTLDFATDDNTILVVIPANTLARIGKYALILTENEGQEGQTAVDANPAFTLVETSREEDTNTTEAPNLEVATINLATGDLTLRMVIQELFDGKDGGDMKTGDILAVLRDGELHRVSAKIGAGTGTGADCSAEIEALTAKVEENTANIAGAISDASEALTAANNAKRVANDAQEENSSQNNRINSIEGRVNNNQERISAVENKNTEQDTHINNIESRLDTDIAGATTAASNALKAAQTAQAAATTASKNAAQAQELATEAKKAADTATRMLRFSSIIYDANIEEQEDAPISPDFLIVFVKGKGIFVASDGGKYYKVFQGSDDYNTTLDGVTKARQDRLYFIQSLEENRYYHYDGVALRHLTTSDPDIAGRVWNEDNGTPKAESYYGSVKALRDLPKRLGLGRYLVNNERQKFKLHPNDSTKYLDGTPAALDGTDGQCMWCWNGFYANIWHEGSRLIKAVTFDGPVGNDISIWIPAGGISWLGAGVIDRGDAPFTDQTKWKLCSVISEDERYRGGGGNALDASKYSKAPAAESPQISMLGMPATMMSTTQFGEAARRRDEGWEANWFVARFVVEFLFEVIMGTENCQEAFNDNKDANGLYQGGFGTGVTDMPDWNGYNGVYPVIPTSVGLEAGDGVCLVPYSLPQTDGAEGEAYKTFNVPVFFGLVGVGFGNLWQWTRGLIMDAGDKSLVYVTPSMYADYYPNTVADKILVAECPQKVGHIKRKSYQGLCCMPTEVGGAATTRFGDYFWTSADTLKGLRVRAAGGDANDGADAGASCTFAHSAASIAKEYFSAPLCYFEEDPVIPETQKIG